MKRTSTFNNLGGLQSLFFCAGVYAVSLFFSIFVCSAVFYAFNPKKGNVQNVAQTTNVPEKAMLASLSK